MASLSEGLGSPAIEQDPSVAQIQAAQLGAQSAQQQVSLPATGFVATINGEDGAITIQPGTSSVGLNIVVTNGLGTVSIGATFNPSTGWTAITGTPSKAGFDTATATATDVAQWAMAIEQALITAGILTT
jgi:hypothetical protein